MHPYGLQPTRLLCPWGSSGKNTGVGGRALLQGIFLTQELNPCLLPLPFSFILNVIPFPLTWHWSTENLGFPGGSVVKNLLPMQETQVQSLSGEGPLEEGVMTRSSILAWTIPGIEEPGGLQSMGSRRVRHD